MDNDTPTVLGTLQVNETRLTGHVHEVVRSSVEETLNAPLNAEAAEICGAQRRGQAQCDEVTTRGEPGRTKGHRDPDVLRLSVQSLTAIPHQ